MKRTGTGSNVLVVLGAAAATVLANFASATPILPDAVSYEYFGFNFAVYAQSSTAIGTLDYSGAPGCNGTCSATTALGASPYVSATANEVTYQYTSGGAPDGTSAVSAALTFGQAGSSFTSLNNFSSVTLQEANCVNGCPSPGFVPTTGPFAPDQTVSVIANTPYFVRLDLLFAPQATGVQISGMVDPTFSASSGGQFIYSRGGAFSGAGACHWVIDDNGLSRQRTIYA